MPTKVRNLFMTFRPDPSEPSNYTWQVGPDTGYSQNLPSYPLRYERMTWNRETGSPKCWCDHVRIDCLSHKDGKRYVQGFPFSFDSNTFVGEGSDALPPAIWRMPAREPYVVDWDAAIEAAVPRITSELSVINTLLELGDIKSVFSDVAQTITFSLRAFFSFAFRSFRTLLAALGDGRLFYAFVVVPTMGEIRSLNEVANNTYEEIIRRVRRIENASKRNFGKAFRQPFNWAQTYNPSARNPTGISYEVDWTFRGTRRVTATGRIKIACNLGTRLAIATRSQGWLFDAGVVWNAIPFSWLIDYFFDVGTALSTPDSAFFTIRLEQTQISEKIEGTLTARENGRVAYRSWYPAFSLSTASAVYRISSYTRSAVTPLLDGYDPRLSVELPSWSQATNLMGLVSSALGSLR